MATPPTTLAGPGTQTTSKIVKPGFKTTEFAITVLTEIGVLGSALAGVLPARYAAIVSAVSVAAYGVSRGLAKR